MNLIEIIHYHSWREEKYRLENRIRREILDSRCIEAANREVQNFQRKFLIYDPKTNVSLDCIEKLFRLYSDQDLIDRIIE